MDEIIEILRSAGLDASRNNKVIKLNNTRQEICRVWEKILQENINKMEGLTFESRFETFYDRIECGQSHIMANEGVTPDDKRDYTSIFPGATLVDVIPEQEAFIQYPYVLDDDQVNSILTGFFPESDVILHIFLHGKEVLSVDRAEGKVYFFYDRRRGPSKAPDMDLGEWLDH